MAFPAIVAAPGATTGSTAATSHNVDLGGSPSAGQLILVFLRFPGAMGTVTFTGYTQIASDSSDATDDTTQIYYRWADGTEGTSDVLGCTSSQKLAALTYRISGAENPATQAPQVSTVAIGTTVANTANPNSLSPTGGAKDYLWFAFAAGGGEGISPLSPAPYTLQASTDHTGTGGATSTNCCLGVGGAQTNASSADPGAFTHAAFVGGWSAFTVAVHPAGAGGITYTKTGFGKEAG